MRWLAEPAPVPKAASTRARRVFAWRPTRVNQYVVWLESYEVFEVYVTHGDGLGRWLETNRLVLDYYPA